MPLSQKAFSGQTNVLCPCNTPSTVSLLLMVHMVYGLTLWMTSWLFLVYWGFVISIYVWAAGCALDTAELKRDGAIRMANYICLHGISRVSRSAISGMSAPPQANRQDSHQPWWWWASERAEKRWTFKWGQQPLTNVPAVVLGERRYHSLLLPLAPEREHNLQE